MPKQARLTRIKSIRCYTYEEAASVTGISVRTIRAWSKGGLRVMDSQRPVLIRGDDLLAYLKAQRADQKCELARDEFYCLSCRKPRNAAEGLADCKLKGNRASLMALCSVCGTAVSKPVPKAELSEFERIFDLKITRPEVEL